MSLSYSYEVPKLKNKTDEHLEQEADEDNKCRGEAFSGRPVPFTMSPRRGLRSVKQIFQSTVVILISVSAGRLFFFPSTVSSSGTPEVNLHGLHQRESGSVYIRQRKGEGLKWTGPKSIELH